jgi:aminopeptidase N
VLRQLWSFLGSKAFFSALQIYLRRHQDECVTPSQLWQAFREASHNQLDVEQMMDGWVTKCGHPYLSVSRSSSGRYELKQRLCVKKEGKAGPRIETDDQGLSLFQIPIVARSPDEKLHRLLMGKGTLRCTEFDECDFVVFNHKSMGFYRVLYDESLLSQVISAEKPFVLEEELCTILVDTLFFFTSDIHHKRISAHTLILLCRHALEKVHSQYLWHLMVQTKSFFFFSFAFFHFFFSFRQFLRC